MVTFSKLANQEEPQVEEWFKFGKSLEGVITGQNIADSQGMYTITKNLLRGDVLTTFENAEGQHRPQSKPAYMCWALAKAMMYSTCKFVGRVNEINKWLALFPPRDDRTPQEKLDDDKIMDILESASPKAWHDEMRHQRFDCVAKGQA
eukprot:2040315-Ditylum_brightwellii.AAC.1